MKKEPSKLNVVLLSHTILPEIQVARSARLCYYGSDINQLKETMTPEKSNQLIEKLTDMGHMSPIEHAVFTFGIEGVSRALTHQLVRHRIASFSQQSQRYVDGGKFNYVLPPSIAENPEAKDEYLKCMDQLFETYQTLKKLNIPNEDARFVLPNGCDTKIIVTMNARELHHFFQHRCCNRAQWEIRALAWKMLHLCKEAAPSLFKNAGPTCLTNNHCGEGDMSCKRPYRKDPDKDNKFFSDFDSQSRAGY